MTADNDILYTILQLAESCQSGLNTSLLAGLVPAIIDVIVSMEARIECSLEDILGIHRVAWTCLRESIVNDGTIGDGKRVLRPEIAKRLAGSGTRNSHRSCGRPSSYGGLGLHLSLLKSPEISVINSIGGETLVVLGRGRPRSILRLSCWVIKRIARWALVGIIVFFLALGVPPCGNDHVLLLPS